MAKNVLDIVINLVKKGGADKETVKGLVDIKNHITNFAAAAGIMVGAGVAIGKALDETVGKLVAYADQVRTVSDATGITAEDASRLIQVLDDQKISFEQLTGAIARNGKEFDFSINGIASMSDQYLQLTDTTQRAQFMQERFGKQWLSFVPLMEKGSDAIKKYAANVSDAQIITQKILDDTRKYEIALDSMKDSQEGLALTLGTKVLPYQKSFYDGINVTIRAIEIAKAKNQDWMVSVWDVYRATDQAGAEIWQEQEAMLANKQAAEQQAAALKVDEQAQRALSQANQEYLSLIGSLSTEISNYQEKQATLAQEHATLLAQKQALLQQGYWPESQAILDINGKLAENEAAQQQNATEVEAAGKRRILSMLEQQLAQDGLSTAETNYLLDLGQKWGVYSAEAVDAAKQAQAEVQRLTDQFNALPTEKTFNIGFNVGYTTTNTVQSQPGGFAEGGIASGPTSGHWELLHGTEAVIPLQGGSVPVQLQGGGGGGGGDVYVNLTVASPMTIMDQQTAQATLLPFIVQGIREAKSRGVLTS